MNDVTNFDEDEHDEEDSPVSRNQPKIPALFRDLGLGSVSTKDKFTISYEAGTLKASVKRSDGVAHTVIRNVHSGFRAMTEFDPDTMRNKAERNKYIRQAVAGGARQKQVAEQFGLSQAMVNRIVNADPE